MRILENPVEHPSESLEFCGFYVISMALAVPYRPHELALTALPTCAAAATAAAAAAAAAARAVSWLQFGWKCFRILECSL